MAKRLNVSVRGISNSLELGEFLELSSVEGFRDVASLDTDFSVSLDGVRVLDCSGNVLDGDGRGLLFTFLAGNGNIECKFIGGEHSSVHITKEEANSLEELLSVFFRSIKSDKEIIKVLVIENDAFLTDGVKRFVSDNSIYGIIKK